ncbi:MAG: glutamyl-tRNA reductase [Pseudohongiellaceae bacterium]
MALLLVGISHNTAHIALREKVAFPPEVVGDALRHIHGRTEVEEVVIVSTCNRTELYLDISETTDAADKANAKEIINWLAAHHSLDSDELHKSSYCLSDEEVVGHLMRVACGLDSMVLGEPQILGQIKSAYAVSKDIGVVGTRLNHAFQAAFAIAKEVRTDTAIGENPVSVAYAAVTLAERLFSHLDRLHVLLIGAGQTIELAATHLIAKGVKHLVVANRTLDNALEIANRVNGHGVLLSDIPEQLTTADIVISSTNSQLPLLGKGAVEKALKQRKHKPMLLIDLAVPRDIEPEAGELDDAYLYSVDDISSVIEDSVKSRAQAAAQASSIIDRGVADYSKQLRSLSAVDTLTAFRRKAETIQAQELARAHKALEQGEDPQAILETLARGITRKLLHSPSVQLKQASAEGRDDIVQLAQELYELEKHLGQQQEQQPEKQLEQKLKQKLE